MDKEEAIKAVALATKKCDAGDDQAALKFVDKALRLDPNAEGASDLKDWLTK